MRCGLYWLLIPGLVVTGCSAARSSSSQSAEQPLPPKPYVRVSGIHSNHFQLQIAARRFLPGQHGLPEVWLTGVSHLGDRSYYSAIQTHLDGQTLVLYEGVGAAEAEGQSQTEIPDSY